MNRDPSRLVLATYNIHGCQGIDRRHDPERIAAVISEIGADVVALQEVSYPREHELDDRTPVVLSALTHFAFIRGPTFTREAHHFGNVLLVRHPVRKLERVDLSSTGREPRGALDVTLDVEGVDVRVVATHLGLRLGERRSQVDRLIEHLDREPAPFEVILGDFNDWIPGRSAAHLLERRLGVSPRVPTYPSPCPVAALDRIWVHPGSALISLRAHSSQLARRASDHLPLVATLAMPEREGAHGEHRASEPSNVPDQDQSAR